MSISARSVHTFPALALFALLVVAPVAGAEPATDLGSLEFPNSGAPEAQEAFTRAVLLLHSFEFDDAAEAFAEARTIDPDFALAYWGEAMTHNHPLWRGQNRDAALGVLAQYAPTAAERAAKAPTERERGYLAALDVLYDAGADEPADKVSRDRAYSEAMGKLSGKYPNDLEAKAFYALSILGIGQGERDFRLYMRAASVAEEVFAANPNHPGAAHYLIHSYDDPIHAPLGLRAARVYAGIAPAASHAQHMISHIFVAMGRWGDSVQSNINAYEVSKQRREAKSLPIEQLNFHALHWLQYSYLQLGLLDDARDTLAKIEGFARASDSERVLGYYAGMRATWIVEAPDQVAPTPLDQEHRLRYGSERAVQDLFASGYRAVRSGEAGAAQSHLEDIRKLLEAERVKLAERENLSDGSAGHSGLKRSTVLERSLAALLAREAGNETQALALLDEATELEASLPLDFGPPEIVKPSHELYGEVLFDLERFEVSAAMFQAALDRAPRRTASLLGLAHAAAAQGGPAASSTLEATCAQLLENTARGAWAEQAATLCGAPGAERAAP